MLSRSGRNFTFSIALLLALTAFAAKCRTMPAVDRCITNHLDQELTCLAADGASEYFIPYLNEKSDNYICHSVEDYVKIIKWGERVKRGKTK